MKHFLLFAGDVYYPCGGWDDFISTHETEEEARNAASSLHQNQWWHIIDIETMKEVTKK